ncbi:MAG: hypothetical protein RL095_484 [Verrucomicrobiota bacterium]|jgi:hypothetical protein
MLSIVIGKQRSGKTYSVMAHYIIPALLDGRKVVTNLPVNVNSISKDYFKGEDISDRIRLLSMDESLEFWIHKAPECLVVLDEAYEIFPATVSLALKSNIHARLDNNDPLPFYFERRNKVKLASEREIWYMQQAELMSYIRQHGHYKDDVVIISHNPLDLHPFVLRGAMEFISVHNSLRTNMLNARFFEGLTYPTQFFIMRHYDTMQEYRAGIVTQERFIKPDPRVFASYDSFSQAQRLSTDDKASDKASSDFKRPYGDVVRRWISDKTPVLIFIGALATVVIAFGYSFITVNAKPMYAAKPQTDAKPLTSIAAFTAPKNQLIFSSLSKIEDKAKAQDKKKSKYDFETSFPPFAFPAETSIHLIFGSVYERGRGFVWFESGVLLKSSSTLTITSKGIQKCGIFYSWRTLRSMPVYMLLPFQDQVQIQEVPPMAPKDKPGTSTPPLVKPEAPMTPKMKS